MMYCCGNNLQALLLLVFICKYIAGIQDRLFTYAKGTMLSEQQLQHLKNEGKEDANITSVMLVENLNRQTGKSIEQLKQTDVNTLTETRSVGRKQIPSTVTGLLFHAAEHTMRVHIAGKFILVTVKILDLT